MKILDCTFRDGGYYNNWDFDLGLVREYLGVMERSGIDAIEIGFRSPGKENFANVTDEFILKNFRLTQPDVEYFGVMVNTSEVTNINDMFCNADKSPINFVRVATHFKDIDKAERICKDLKNLDYTVACNLMQASTKTMEEIEKAAERVKGWGIDVLYFADSLGGMGRGDIWNIYSLVSYNNCCVTGFHAHNNKGRALANSLYAERIGVDWIDGTILGMGRGAGNAETEYLLTEFDGYRSEEAYELVMKFLPLKEMYGWGTNLFYYLAAEYEIHPTYVQQFLHIARSFEKGISSYQAVLNAINYLKDKKATSFNKELYEESIK